MEFKRTEDIMAHNDSIEQCKNVFVSWVWMISILLGYCALVGSLAWAASAELQVNTAAHALINSRLYAVERNTEKLDTILVLLRSR